jgi:type II secretory pathway component PulM
MNQLLERLRGAWEALNDREKSLVGALGLLLALFVLGFPLFWTVHQNGAIADENEQIKKTLELIDSRRAQLLAVAEARKSSAARYKNRTPPLGSFLEEQAKRFSLTIREVTDQPEKSTGGYHRRSVRASINDVGLTGVIDLLSSLVTSPYPVAVDQIQIEHFQPGDTYRFKLGVLTFDKTEAKAQTDKSKTAGTDSAGGG